MSTDREDDFDRGVRHRRAVLGDAWVDRSLGGADAFDAEFQSLITRHAWHDIWGRPDLDPTTRRLLVLAMTMALGRWEEFELHCRAAVRGGVPPAKIREVLMQGAIYCGVPSANTAFRHAGRILREEGIASPPSPLTQEVRVASHRTFSVPQIHVALQGQGPPVMLSHALGLDLTMWDELAARLATRPEGPHEVLRHDHRGHGESAAPPGPYRMDDLVDDAARVLREWGRGPVAFVGLSMGGMVGQGLAIRYPELVSRLVLANTVARYTPEMVAGWRQRMDTVRVHGVAAIAEMVVERYLHADFRARHPEAAERIRARLLRDEAAPYAACCEAVAGVDWLDRLGEIRCPTLVISGARDVGAPPAEGQAIAQRVPDAVFRVIDDASHLSVVEAPNEFATLVGGFLRTESA